MGARAVPIALIAAVLGFGPVLAEGPARAAVRPAHRLAPRAVRLRFRLFPRYRRPLPIPRIPDLQLQTPDEIPPPEVPLPSEPEGPPEPYFLPHGFTLTVPVNPGSMPTAPNPITRYPQVATALGACWRPPTAPADTGWKDITLRVSFKRDGTVNGVPRVPYVGAGTDTAKADLAQSLLAALRACTPLPFSPSLGAAIAGEIYAIRFTNGTIR